ncbi:hypothetical protein ACH4E8_01420 [Streptomyces sp. NPDC017979]|uniref:hypothetical protein n=1 Tax=Streptomyces sp. NPDC017979 TaxID=3365024 RepID=UPI00378DB1C4
MRGADGADGAGGEVPRRDGSGAGGGSFTGPRQWRPRTWGALALAMLVLVGGGTYAVRAHLARQQLADNRTQLAEACWGLLPREHLRPHLPNDTPGRRVEYGTLLHPDRESGALLDCRLSWGGVSAEVRATAPLRPGPDAPDTAQRPDAAFPLALPANALGSADGDEESAAAVLVVTCPNGLARRTGRSTDLQVRVSLPLARPGTPEGAAGPTRTEAARTAAAVADRIAVRQNCGGTPLGELRAAPARPDASLCRWLDADALGLAGAWTARPTGPYATRGGRCELRAQPVPQRPGDVVAIEAASASGAWSRDLVEQQQGGGLSHVAAAATARCGGVATYHQVLVRTQGPEAVDRRPNREQAAEQSRLARAALDRYVTAEGAWPDRSGCRDTRAQGVPP